MTLLRAMAINACLSLATIVCLFKLIESEYITADYWTTTSTTLRPFTRTPGLSLPIPHVHPPKCLREVPAVFFQVEKDVPITGNSTGNPYMNVIQVCCDGYKRYDFDWSKCVPDCGEKCQNNGFCVAGGKCQCFDEFVLNHRNECVSTCPLGCPNGQCYLNGTCVCNKGYELDPTLKYCIPQCEKGCGHNELCEEPNKCVCAEGYAKSNSLSLAMGCQPICLPDCGYGHCVAPNECACFPGYRKRENGTACTADCYMRCENGFCANRTTCICQNGYRYDMNTTTCLPDCGDNCENGVCIQPGVCRCFNGYEHDGITCKAICEHGCGFYGKCIGHNVCGCAIVDGPFSSYQQCSLGNCNGVGRCRCQEGTTRFLNQCLSPDRVTTYGSMQHQRLNETFVAEFQLLIGRHFMFLRNTTFYDDWARYQQHHSGNGGYRYR